MIGGTLVRTVLHWVAPEGTMRRKLVRIPQRFARSVEQRGLAETFRVARAKVRRRWLRTANGHFQQWCNETAPNHATLAVQRYRAMTEPCPSIALIIPVSRHQLGLLRDTIRSIRSQSNPDWTLHFIADSDCVATVQNLGGEQAKIVAVPPGSDPRRAPNSALATVQASYVGVMDAGDSLAPDALFELGEWLRTNPECDAVYSDEDCRSAKTLMRHGLVLKPEWSPEMILGSHYVGRLCLVRRELLNAVGGFRSEDADAQEYDAILRIAEKSLQIHRVPKCLYHRLAEPGTGPESTRPAAYLGGSNEHLEAVRRHLQRRGFDATARKQSHGTHRVTWPLRHSPRVSVIIPTLNNLAVLKVCIEGLIHKTDYPDLEIILVDNNSTDPNVYRYYDELTLAGHVKIVPYHKPFNYSEACNYGARAASGDIFLFLNNDIEMIHRDWLQEMVRFCLLPGVGCVGTRLRYPDGVVQHAGVVIGMHMTGLVYNRTAPDHRDCFGGSAVYRDLLAIMGACQMIPRSAFDRVGGFDERYRIANSDVAICLRLYRAGLRTVYTPYAELLHHEGCTRGKVNPIEDLELTAQDLREMEIAEDPYYHPALSPHHAVPTLRLFPEPSPRDFLKHQVIDLAPKKLKEPLLDPFDDESVTEALGVSARHFGPLHWTPDDVARDDAAAARLIVQVLRQSPELRDRFPRALSDGEHGMYCHWLCSEGAVRFGLSDATIERIRSIFRNPPGNKIRQVYEFRHDVRHYCPVGMLPEGKRSLFHWMVNDGKGPHALRDEQIWWWLVESAECPAQELIYTYLVSPEWQANFPEALSESGWPTFVKWVSKRYAVAINTADTPFESPVPILHQLRLAYDHRGRWRLQVPNAFASRAMLERLVKWLRSDQNWERGDYSPDWINRVSDSTEPMAGVNILGHFHYPSGLQVSVRSVAESLKRLGVPTSLRDVPAEMATDKPGRKGYLGLELHDVTLIHVQPEPFWEGAYFRAGLNPARQRHRIGMWYWEFGEVPSDWKRHAENIKELWAPTRFIARALEQVMPVPVYTMLPGVELSPVIPIDRAKYGLPRDKFLFLFMYDMNSIQERKNPLGLIAAYRDAFRRDDRAALVIKVSRGKNNPGEFARLMSAAKKVGAIVIDQTIPRDDVYGLIDACDCYVSLHRSEGLGLTMAEAMLLGKPVIATNYSGNVDFMTPADSMLVGYKLVPLEHDIQPYKKGYLWAEPSRSEAAHWMRWAFEHQDEAAALGLKARPAAEKVLSMEASGRRMLDRLTTIWGHPLTTGHRAAA